MKRGGRSSEGKCQRGAETQDGAGERIRVEHLRSRVRELVKMIHVFRGSDVCSGEILNVGGEMKNGERWEGGGGGGVGARRV